MRSPKTEFYLSRAESAHFETMHGYRGRLKIRDLSDDVEIFELALPADHGAIDV